MKKRIISLLTTLVMVVGLVGVVPTVSVGAVNAGFDVEHCLFYDYPIYLKTKTDTTSSAKDACYAVMNSYSKNDENMAALLKSLKDGGEMLVQDFFAGMGIGITYEEELQRKAVMSYLNTSTRTSVQFKKSVNKVSNWFSTAKSAVSTLDSQVKVKDCLSDIVAANKLGITYDELSATVDKIYGNSAEIIGAIGDALGAATDAMKIASFALESFELYIINIDYVNSLMQYIPSTSALYKSLNFIRSDLQDPVKYFSDKILSSACIDGICSLADWWTPTAYKVYELALNIYTKYFSPWADADDIIITYYLDAYANTLNSQASKILTDIMSNGATDSKIYKFKFLYNEYVACLGTECNSAAKMAKKDDTAGKKACEKYEDKLSSYDYNALIGNLFYDLHQNHIVEIPVNNESDFEWRNVNGGVEITGFSGLGDVVNIPSQIRDKDVVSIIGTFNNEDVFAVTIPDTVDRIYDSFNRCNNLVSVIMSANIRSISGDSFSAGSFGYSNCLKSLSYPDEYYRELIGNSQHLSDDIIIKGYKGSRVEYVAKENGLRFESLGNTQKWVNGLLLNNDKTEVLRCMPVVDIVDIPQTVKKIGGSAFKNCKVSNITIPDSVTYIGTDAFLNCAASNITIPDSVTYIGNYAFANCKASNITIPENVTYIGYCAFCNSNISEKSSVVIPKSVTHIDRYAFANSSTGGVSTIYGYKNTEAEQYAKEYSITFVPIVCENEKHSYTKTVEKEATCTAEGTMRYTCEDCNDQYTEIIPAKGHSERLTVISPTCTKNGYTIHKCKICDNEYNSDFVSAIGHKYSETKTDATCNSNGIIEYKCTQCSDRYTEIIPKGSHTYQDIIVEPSCTKQGYTNHICTICGVSYKDTYVNANGHKYTKKISLMPTDESDGIMTYTCSVCADSFDEVIWSTAHNYISKIVLPTCTEQGYTEHKCSVCGDVYEDNYTDAIGHNYVEEIIQPTETEQGYTLHTCTICGDSYKDNYTDYKPIIDVIIDKIDINADGNISTADVGLINAHAKGTRQLSGEALKKADVNKDGKVSTADVGLINAYAKGTKKYA